MSFNVVRVDEFTKGIVDSETAFKIPDNAFVDMVNAYPLRNRVRLRDGNRKLARLRRCLTGESLANSPASPATAYTDNILTTLGLESTSQLEQSSIRIIVNGVITVDDDGDGGFTRISGETLDSANSSINYATGEFTITISSGNYNNDTVTTNFCYFPGLPVMGIHNFEQVEINFEETLAFDTTYAYTFNNSTNKFEEFITGTTWTGTDANFFNGVNYYTNVNNENLFWTTNFSGIGGDPIRYTNGTSWTDFQPIINSNGTVNKLHQCLLLIPFRGMLLALNTYEGETLATSENYKNRVRGSQIGSPLETDAWRDDIPGKGFFFDLPTNQAIMSYGFVRDNLVIFTERETWLLSFTGSSAVPVVDQRENTDLGIESTYSTLNFDDNVVGIGNRYIVSSDSVDTRQLNEDIPDFAFQIHNQENGRRRVHGVRNYQERLALWTYPEHNKDQDSGSFSQKFPNRILVWNYVLNTWSKFRDNITTFGVYQSNTDTVWADVTWTWEEWTRTWTEGVMQAQYENIIGGNQNGYVMEMATQLVDDPSMPIGAIQTVSNQVQLTINDHNLEANEFIKIEGVIGDFSFLNTNRYQVGFVDKDTVSLFELSGDEIIPLEYSGDESYLGGGEAALMANFRLLSKKFNLIDQGKKLFLPYMDLLLDVLKAANKDIIINLNVFKDYRDEKPLTRSDFWDSKVIPILTNKDTPNSDKVFNKNYIGTIADFVQYELTVNNINMLNQDPSYSFEIDSIVLHIRPTGKLTL
jgi:hypothetical protein